MEMSFVNSSFTIEISFDISCLSVESMEFEAEAEVEAEAATAEGEMVSLSEDVAAPLNVEVVEDDELVANLLLLVRCKQPSDVQWYNALGLIPAEDKSAASAETAADKESPAAWIFSLMENFCSNKTQAFSAVRPGGKVDLGLESTPGKGASGVFLEKDE